MFYPSNLFKQVLQLVQLDQTETSFEGENSPLEGGPGIWSTLGDEELNWEFELLLLKRQRQQENILCIFLYLSWLEGNIVTVWSGDSRCDDL